MNTIRLSLVLPLGLLLGVASSVAHAQYESPYSSPYGGSGGSNSHYGRSPSQQFTPYADGSSRPTVPDHLGRFNDDEYTSNQRQRQGQNPYYPAPLAKPQQEATPPPAASHDFNVWKDGKPTLWTVTPPTGDVYCY